MRGVTPGTRVVTSDKSGPNRHVIPRRRLRSARLPHAMCSPTGPNLRCDPARRNAAAIAVAARSRHRARRGRSRNDTRAHEMSASSASHDASATARNSTSAARRFSRPGPDESMARSGTRSFRVAHAELRSPIHLRRRHRLGRPIATRCPLARSAAAPRRAPASAARSRSSAARLRGSVSSCGGRQPKSNSIGGWSHERRTNSPGRHHADIRSSAEAGSTSSGDFARYDAPGAPDRSGSGGVSIRTERASANASYLTVTSAIWRINAANSSSERLAHTPRSRTETSASTSLSRASRPASVLSGVRNLRGWSDIIIRWRVRLGSVRTPHGDRGLELRRQQLRSLSSLT